MFITSFIHDKLDWKNSHVSTSIFLSQQKEQLEHVSIGTILDIDLFEKLDITKQRFFLNYVIDRLKIKTIKLILRWKNIEQKEGEISLLKYTKILDFLYDKDIDIVLDIRFYSTLSRGRLDFPSWVKKRKNPSVVTKLESKKGKLVYSYNERLIHSLSLISQKYLRKITAIHIESSSVSETGTNHSLESDLYTELLWKWRAIFSSKKLFFSTRDNEKVKKVITLLDENQWFRSIFIEKAFTVKNQNQIFSLKGVGRRNQFEKLTNYVKKYNFDPATSLYVSNNIPSKLSITHVKDVDRLKYGLLRSARFFGSQKGIVFVHDLDTVIFRIIQSKSFHSDTEIVELVTTINHDS
jgi:hypothetical protein